ncbi:hypothetical protein O181_013112 [Austropuccinia psidii MF-1]|uniref:Retrotransposon gag domain-containing protein n=1 Tax=Austropuccinia psidii MF-1 TaxID=1389203 RepID=A0A9Q3GNM3_9BASI|nr:hypothetical protein [Austropuccinia psidii MF-1]
MPIQHSPPARKTRSQARTKAVLTSTPRAPLDGTPTVPQLRAKLDRGPILEGAAPSRKEGRGPRRSNGEEEEEESDGTEGFPAPVGVSQGTEGPAPAQSNATSFLIGRAAKWIGPYISNLTNRDQNYLLNSWKLFESQLFNLFGDPNEVRKAEIELDYLRMKEGGHVSLYIADFRSLVSRLGDWGERGLIHHFRKGLTSRILDQLASHPSRIESLQDLMDITLELDTMYHERQNKKSNNQEKKQEASKSHSSHPKISSSSSQKKTKNIQKRDKPHSYLLKKDFKFMNSEKERSIKEGLCTYCGGKHSLESCFKRPQKKLT